VGAGQASQVPRGTGEPPDPGDLSQAVDAACGRRDGPQLLLNRAMRMAERQSSRFTSPKVVTAERDGAAPSLWPCWCPTGPPAVKRQEGLFAEVRSSGMVVMSLSLHGKT
jgi:hypothetical protein